MLFSYAMKEETDLFDSDESWYEVFAWREDVVKKERRKTSDCKWWTDDVIVILRGVYKW